MLKPTVRVHSEEQAIVAEFWDCLRLDLNAVKDLRGKYETELRSSGRPMLVVDLLGVGFAGSAALGLFVTLQRLVRQEHGQIIFCNVDPSVYEVFRISRLTAQFLFVADRPAALMTAARLTREAEAHANGAAEPKSNDPAEPTDPARPRDPGTDGLHRRHRRRNL